ncbi:hypothetical protein FRB93_011866 [Tulasnella sp. JGI-2019a]|nr:hypothetical protein FRB93_011866 [Tulasnella sp. JGI-2019a]
MLVSNSYSFLRWEIDRLLSVPRQIEAPLRLQPAEWSDALYLSTRWGFSAVREHVIAEIEDQCDDQGPLDRFELALKCRVSQWLRPVYHALCSRNEHITAEEGRRLGYKRLTAICRIREVLRGKSQPNSINDQCWRCEYCYTNRPCRFPLEASGEDTLEWIDKAEHLQASFDGMEEEIGVAISAPLPRIVPENPDKRDSAITASIPVRNIGDSVETIPSIPLRSQAEDIQVAFNMVTEVPRPSPPIIVISGDPYTSTQTATIAQSAQVTVFSDKRENLQVPPMDATQSVCRAASRPYIEITQLPTPDDHFNSQPTRSSRHMQSFGELPSVMSICGVEAELSPTMTRAQLDAIQNPHDLISEHYVEAVHTEVPSTTIDTSNAHQEFAKPGVATNYESAPAPLAVTGAIQGKGKEPNRLCHICWKAKPNVCGKQQACERCRGITQCVICLQLTKSTNEATQTCAQCRFAPARDAKIGAGTLADYPVAWQKSLNAIIARAGQSTDSLMDPIDMTGVHEVMQSAHDSPSPTVVIDRIVTGRVARAVAKKQKGKEGQGHCATCKSLGCGVTEVTSKCTSCRQSTEMATAAITGYSAGSGDPTVAAPAPTEKASNICNSTSETEAIPVSVTPAAFDSSPHSEAGLGHTVMEDEEADAAERASDSSSQQDREFEFVSPNSEDSAM